MKPAKGYYCIVQYCPDASRLEAANVGVLLFCPERRFIEGIVASGNDRIRRFFGSEDNDWDQINAVKASIVDRLEVEQDRFRTLEDLQRFIDSRANEMQITPPRPMKVTNPDEDLRGLFDELVGGRTRRARKATIERHDVRYVRAALNRAFAHDNVARRVRRDVTVTVPVFQKNITVPYGYQNGKFNLIQPVSFDLTDEEGIIDRACHQAVEGRSLFASGHQELGDLQLNVVGLFPAEQPEAVAVVRGILDNNDVRLHTLDQIGDLVRNIEETGQPVSQ